MSHLLDNDLTESKQVSSAQTAGLTIRPTKQTVRAKYYCNKTNRTNRAMIEVIVDSAKDMPQNNAWYLYKAKLPFQCHPPYISISLCFNIPLSFLETDSPQFRAPTTVLHKPGDNYGFCLIYSGLGKQRSTNIKSNADLSLNPFLPMKQIQSSYMTL